MTWAILPSSRGCAFDLPDLCEVLRETKQQLLAQVHVRDLAATELHHGLHAITFLKETDARGSS